jgi:hypothetical protein
MEKDEHYEKLGHVRQVNLAAIRPHPLNDKLYAPVDPDDPAIRDLAKDIRKNGVLEPLVLTKDFVVLSGHRRRVAAGLARLTDVPCRVMPFNSEDARCLALLASHNKHRVKTADEILREEVIDASTARDSHRRLIEHRKRNASVQVQQIKIEGVKHRWQISKAKRPMLDAVLRVLESYRQFLPVTLRRIHYALLNDPPLRHAGKPGSRYRNTVQSYKDLSDLLLRARQENYLPWEWVHDPTRPVTNWACHDNVQDFMREQFKGFLRGYHRDYLQSQPNHIEMVGEKITLDGVIRPVVGEYGIRVTTGRGYCSYSKLKEMADRFEGSGKEKLVVLFLSDFDPEGEDIPHAFARCLRDDHDIEEYELVPVKVALTEAQVRQLGLPPQMTAKEGSSRRDKFVEQHGEQVFELEAVPPERLQAILRDAINSVIEVNLFNAEIDREGQDAADLDRIRRRLLSRVCEIEELDDE